MAAHTDTRTNSVSLPVVCSQLYALVLAQLSVIYVPHGPLYKPKALADWQPRAACGSSMGPFLSRRPSNDG